MQKLFGRGRSIVKGDHFAVVHGDGVVWHVAMGRIFFGNGSDQASKLFESRGAEPHFFLSSSSEIFH